MSCQLTEKIEFNIGDTIQDIEDGDCYFEGIVTQVKNNKVTKYKLCKIIWSEKEDTECKDLNTEIEPRWWYITKNK
jgi:hypothetical protein